MRSPRRLTLVIAVVAAALLVMPGMALAQESTVGTHTVEINGYDVDFTLPTAAKAGCLVCHGDENLIRLREDRLVSYYVDVGDLEDGPHAAVQCVGCHIDFAFTAPHTDHTEDWRRVAGSACKNCHQEQNFEFGQGVHRVEVGNGNDQVNSDAEEKPVCSTCHGSHGIQSLEEGSEGAKAMHLNGYEVCGTCHEDYWESYNDYYHGRAYRRGALDAPACWDCHGWHDILPSSDRASRVHDSRLAETCGACHPDVNEGYIAYAELIHGQREVLEKNPLFALIQRVRSAIAGVFNR